MSSSNGHKNGRRTATMREAAEYMYEHPGVSFTETAEQVGISRITFWEWRKTEEWEVTFRQVGADHAPKLIPAAIAALLKAWAKGNPAGAIDTLRSYGLLSPEKVKVDHSGRIETQVFAAELAAAASILETGTGPGSSNGAAPHPKPVLASQPDS